MRFAVLGASNVRRHVGVIPEEGGVERSHAGRGVAGTLHADGREVDVKVTAEARNSLRVGGIEVAVLVGAAADEPGFVSRNDSAVPRKRPTQGADRVGQDLPGIRSGVVGKPLACWPVGYPAVGKVRSVKHGQIFRSQLAADGGHAECTRRQKTGAGKGRRR